MKKLSVKIEGEKLVFDVPQTWEELDLEIACRVMEAMQSNTEDNYYVLLAALLDLPLDKVMFIQADSLKVNVLSELGWLGDSEGWKRLDSPKCPDTLMVEDTVFRIERDISKGTLSQMEQGKQLLESDSNLHTKCIEVLNIYVNRGLMNEEDFKATMNTIPAIDIFPVCAFFLNKLNNTFNFFTKALKTNAGAMNLPY